MTPDSAPLDTAMLLRQTGGDLHLAREVLGLFVTQAQTVKQDLLQGGSETSAADLHRLKGSALAVGAASIAACADALERCLDGYGGSDNPEFATERLVAAIDDACRFAAKLAG